MSNEKDEQKTYNCLFNTIIVGSDKCIFEEFIPNKHQSPLFNSKFVKVKHRLDLQNEIQEAYEQYDNLVLFTNESIEYEGTVYYRVYRIVYEDCYGDLNPLKKFGIYLYTTGITHIFDIIGTIKPFILMVGRKIIQSSSCPIALYEINDILLKNDLMLHSKIPSELFEVID